jgi:hypothetical protein
LKTEISTTTQAGHMVMLDGCNITSKQQYCKLEDILFVSFKIIKVGSNKQWCKLESPTTWKIHPSFDVAILEPY